MESLANLESFVRSAESGSFSAAARRLGLTPAAVSRNVAQLERNLGVRLFQRSTRGLTPTEAGERFLQSVRDGLDGIQEAIADLMVNAEQASGVLKISVSTGFGMDRLLPLMPAFRERYPAVTTDWFFDNRQVDFVADGFDVAVGGGFDLAPGMVARELGEIHLIAVASPAFLAGKHRPKDPGELAQLAGIVTRSAMSGRARTWVMRNEVGTEMAAAEKPVMLVNDPDALCRATLLGLGVGLVAVPHALPHLASGALERLLPNWHVNVGPISLYFTNQKLLPAKTRAFVDFVTQAFRVQKQPTIDSVNSKAGSTPL